MSESSRSLDALLPELYGEMRRLAAWAMQSERPDHTLQPTALVHEAYLRLYRIADLDTGDRRRLLALASRTMRRILVDHARARKAAKRGAGGVQVTLAEDALSTSPPFDLIALDEALDRLEALDPRQARILELRFLAGLSVPETAEAVGVSEPTVKRETATGRAWLYREMMGSEEEPRA